MQDVTRHQSISAQHYSEGKTPVYACHITIVYEQVSCYLD